MRKRIYISGPISLGDLRHNIDQAVGAFVELARAGFAPFCPALTAYLEGPKPTAAPCGIAHDEWMEIDLPWVAVADAVLRLPGKSEGADREVAFAQECGIPAYLSIKTLIATEHDDSVIPFKPPRSGGDPEYLAILDDMRTLHQKKAADYGSDSDPFANIRRAESIGIPAWKAAWVRALDKVGRIDRFCVKGSLVNESVDDSLMDLAAYSLIALVFLRRARKEQA